MSVENEARFVDVSHTLTDGMVTYPGLPVPVIQNFLTREESRKHYAAGVEFHIGSIELVANTGTYLDSPFHRYADGDDLSELSLESIANLDGQVVRVTDQDAKAIGAAYFRGIDVKGKAILVYTGWDQHWGSESYFTDNPYLTKDAAELLAKSGARLVGIDSLNIDDTKDLTRPAHSTLLRARIPIVEHLCNLASLPDTGFRFFAVPTKIKGMGTFPVRAFGLLKNTSAR